MPAGKIGQCVVNKQHSIKLQLQSILTETLLTMLPYQISPLLADDIHGHPDVFLDEETAFPFSPRVNDAEGTVKQVVGKSRRASLTSTDSQASGCWESKLSCITANSECVGRLCYTS